MPVFHSMPSVCAIIQYSILKCLKALSVLGMFSRPSLLMDCKFHERGPTTPPMP